MNAPLKRALDSLKGAGATGTPSIDTVEAAKDGTQWSGKKSNGDRWSMTKNREDSYNCEF